MNVRQTWFWAACLSCSVACDDSASTPVGPSDALDEPEEIEDTVDAPDEACEVPNEPAELIAYLQRGDYKTFERESGVHASTGPHGGRVLTYVNDVLFDSLTRGNAEHPRCAASIKELFRGSDEVSGWAVFVKTEDASAKGKGYYWLEITSTRAGRSADYEGQGIGICVGCHSAGRDFFRAPWPLQ